MTVKDLKRALLRFEEDSEVLVMVDPEGNRSFLLDEAEVMFVEYGDLVTPEEANDPMTSQEVCVLWPV